MPRTLLLADDSVTIQKVVGISFANEDVQLVTVDNGDDALARARELRPDIVLADVVMPGLNGYEVCEAIKSDPSLRHIPVLLLTGTFEAFDQARAERAGADGHIAKPFEAQALVDTVNAKLTARSAPEAQVPAGTEEPAAESAPEDPLAAEAFAFFEEEDETPAPRVELAPASEAPSGEPFAWERDASGGDVFDFDEPQEELAPEPVASEGWPGHGPRRGASRPEPAAAEDEIPRDHLDETGILAGAGPELDEGEPELLEALAEPDEPSWRPVGTAPAAADDGLDALFAPEEHDGPAELEMEPFEEDEAPLLAEVGPDELAADTIMDPDGGHHYDVSSSDLGDPLGAMPEAPELEAAPPQPPPERAVPVTATPPREAQPPVALTEDMRQQLHDSLEKIAWESFGDVSERIVRESVQRIEQVAWEVIPQLAEALIREEIRRLKGDPE